MKKLIKYILLAFVIILLGYNAVYVKKLSEVLKGEKQEFGAASFTKKIWDEKMPAKITSAVDLSILIKEVEADKEVALKKYTNALAIGNYRYALIKTQAVVTEVPDDEVKLQIVNGNNLLNATLTTEYVYGNAVRDASGLIDIKDFPNTNNLNAVSEEMNKLVRTTVVPAFKKTVKKGDKITVTAALELNKEHLKWNDLELIPVSIQTIQ